MKTLWNWYPLIALLVVAAAYYGLFEPPCAPHEGTKIVGNDTFFVYYCK